MYLVDNMVKEIYLANNKGIALVDDEDYKILNQYKWHFNGRGYAVTTVKINNERKNIKMHRFILKSPCKIEVDHINGNSLNNQKVNLRLVTRSQNMMNRISNKNSSSKYKGVSWYRQNKKWMSQIMFNKKQHYLGLFNSEKDAAKAYNKSAEELFGEYAKLNIVD